MQILCIAILTLISGRVVDGKTGEPIDRARVSIGDVNVVTGSDGAFIIPDAALPLTLNVTAVGYATSKKTVRTSEEITIVLVPEGAELTENVTVTTDPFEGMEAAAASERSLNKAELQSTSMVLVGDALRAAQSLPGVVANNDLRADFTLRGASPEHVAVVVDGVLTDNFVHTFAGADSSDRLSLSLISQDTVSDLSIMPGAFPSSFGGSTAAITSIETRDGNRVRPTGRFGTGIITTNGVVDGPLAGNRGAWLLSGRTSYADYVERLVRKITGTATKDDSELNFSDASFNVNYDLSPTMNVGIRSVFGVFGGNQGKANREKNKDDPDAIDTFDSRNHLLNVRLSYAKTAKKSATKKEKPVTDGRAGSKKATILELLRRKEGATIAEIAKATDCRTTSIRGFISGTISYAFSTMMASSACPLATMASMLERQNPGIRRSRFILLTMRS